MTVRLGVVGCGRVTELRHLPALRNVAGVEVAALAEVDDARLERAAHKYGVARRYRDYRELIETGGVDAVAVCVPPRLHTEVALAALDAGKHLFIEKPLALSLGECDLLSQRAANAEASKVMVGFNMRWHRLVREARAVVDAGVLGEIKMVQTAFTSGIRNSPDFPEWRRRCESGGGALLELGVHHFDLVRFLLRSEAEEVYASSAQAEETAIVAGRMSDGSRFVSAFSEGTGENQEVEVYGREGWLRVSGYRADGLELFGPGEYPGAVGRRLRKLARLFRELPRVARQLRRGGDYVGSYAAEWQHFVEAIETDAPVESTLEDGRRALEIALAAREASSTGSAVEINRKLAAAGHAR